jgi:hypothetical protein
MNIKEEWRWVAGYENLYEISNIGRLRSYKKRGSNTGHYYSSPETAKILTPIYRKGYPNYSLYNKHGIYKHKLAHRLVLEAFVGPCPTGMECCHNDGNRKNCVLSNLRWDTPKNNGLDRIIHGTSKVCSGENHWSKTRPEDTLKGENNAAAKLTDIQVYNIIDILTKELATKSELARYYRIDQTIPGRIIARKKWQHIVYPVPEPLHSEYTKDQHLILRFVEEDRRKISSNRIPPPRGPKKITPRKSTIPETTILEIFELKNKGLSDREVSLKVALDRRYVNDLINGKIKCFAHLKYQK